MPEKPLFTSVEAFLDMPVRDLLNRLKPSRTTDLHGISIPGVGNVVVCAAYGTDADWLAETIKTKGGEHVVKYAEGTVPGREPAPAEHLSYHMAQSIEGALKNYTLAEFDRQFKGCFKTETGRVMSTKAARVKLQALYDQGVRVIPMGADCDIWDPVTGCPGHPQEVQ
jgi:hypothetical protein